MAANNRAHDNDDNEGENGRNGSRSGGRGAAGATEAASRGGQNSHGGQSGKSGQSNGQAMGATQRRVINRAVRVLNEIEERIHELREELEEQMGVPSGSTRSKRSSGSTAGDDDHEAGGQGKVKHPESDRRLKANRDNDDENDDDNEDDGEETNNGRGRQETGRRSK